MSRKISRRRLIGLLGGGAAAISLGAYQRFGPKSFLSGPDGPARVLRNAGWTAKAQEAAPGSPTSPASPEKRAAEKKKETTPALAIARNAEPGQLVDAAVQALGGMKRFVSRGDRVLVKPNIGWDRKPRLAANTNPEVVARLVELCLDAGAKQVTVMDRPCNDPRRCYANSGIEAAAKKAGARVVHADTDRVKSIDFKGEVLDEWDVFDEILKADVRINVPVAKHHSLARVTLGMKNWMGCVGGFRGRMHQDIHNSVVDLAAWFRPALTVLDAYRMLVTNGPSGGRLKDVRIARTLCAGVDPVAVDTFGASLFDLEPDDLKFLSLAEKRGLGTRGLGSLPVREIDLRGRGG